MLSLGQHISLISRLANEILFRSCKINTKLLKEICPIFFNFYKILQLFKMSNKIETATSLKQFLTSRQYLKNYFTDTDNQLT